jgi:hypothetical protein
MINLITSFYIIKKDDELSKERNIELQNCLKNNMNNQLIKKIHLFLDDKDALDLAKNIDDEYNKDNNKLIVIKIGAQPYYSELFEYCIDHLKDEICMISNSDIFLYKCDLDCLNKLNDNIFALSRYEHDLTSPIISNGWGSHDAFIFKSPLVKDFLPHINHIQNIAGSDDSIVNNLVDNGYKLFNPAFQIIIVHLHKSNLRTYDSVKIAHGKYYIKALHY